MLEHAIKYQDILRIKFRETWFNERYKFWNSANYFEDFTAQDSTWVEHQFASVRNGEVIGYIGYKINRADGDAVYALSIINFEESPSATFSLDLGKALKNIFEKYNFRKLTFSVIVGNPIEKAYDKMCERYGGRIVGTLKENVRLFDGKYYDEKLYEIMREDYFNNAEMRNLRNGISGSKG